MRSTAHNSIARIALLGILALASSTVLVTHDVYAQDAHSDAAEAEDHGSNEHGSNEHSADPHANADHDAEHDADAEHAGGVTAESRMIPTI